MQSLHKFTGKEKQLTWDVLKSYTHVTNQPISDGKQIPDSGWNLPKDLCLLHYILKLVSYQEKDG